MFPALPTLVLLMVAAAPPGHAALPAGQGRALSSSPRLPVLLRETPAPRARVQVRDLVENDDDSDEEGRPRRSHGWLLPGSRAAASESPRLPGPCLGRAASPPIGSPLIYALCRLLV